MLRAKTNNLAHRCGAVLPPMAALWIAPILQQQAAST